MRKLSFANRLFALLLALVLVVGLGPAANLTEVSAANEEPVVVIAGSDFQSHKEVNGNKVDDFTGGAAQVKSLLNAIKKDGHSKADGFLFVGDYNYPYVPGDAQAASASTSGKKALQKAVQDVYGKNLHEVYIQGNHDPDGLTTNGTLSASGAHDSDHYGVYVINEKDYDWGGEDEGATINAANAMGKYLDAKVAEGYTKPIFVLCHIPLHFSMRTYKADEGDGLYAYYLFDELNKAGAAGLNIIFLFGHNHSGGWDDYLGGGAIYLAKGDKINICQGNQQKWEVETLNFTYMNAGYVSYYRNVNTGSECDLTMTAFEITGDKVVIKRYSKDGVHDLKSKGVRNNYAAEHFGPYWNTVETYRPDTKVYASPQVISLVKKADTAALEKAIATAEAIKEADYTQESYTALQNAITAAKAVIAKSNPTQKEVDAATTALNDAITALEKYAPQTNKNVLSKAIANAEAVNADQYTAESYAALSEALKNAKAVMQNANATQAEADSAAAALEAAIKALKEKPAATDPTDPEETNPPATDPAQTDPVETDPVETDPAETDPVETDPVETDPVETDPTATDPVETEPTDPTDPVETDPVETNKPTEAPAANNNAKEEPKNNTVLIVVIVVAVLAVAGAAVVIIKKKRG